MDEDESPKKSKKSKKGEDVRRLSLLPLALARILCPCRPSR